MIVEERRMLSERSRGWHILGWVAAFGMLPQTSGSLGLALVILFMNDLSRSANQ